MAPKSCSTDMPWAHLISALCIVFTLVPLQLGTSISPYAILRPSRSRAANLIVWMVSQWGCQPADGAGGPLELQLITWLHR